MSDEDKIGGKLEQSEAGTADKNYDNEFKRLVCNWLQEELEVKTDKSGHTISDEILESRKQKRRIGWGVAVVAAIVPLVMLSIMVWLMVCRWDGMGGMREWTRTAFISGSFLSFIVIYAALIKGMFSRTKEEEEEGALPIKEASDLLREFRDDN